MKTRYGLSPWIQEFPETRRPTYDTFRGDKQTDVVIIGGGLVGCATALAVATAGRRPILLEAARIGQGGAGRGAGLLLPEPGPSFRALAGAHGLRATRVVFEAWRKAALDATALLRRTGIKLDVSPLACFAVATSDDRELRREFEARSAAGMDGQLFEGRRLPPALRAPFAAGMRMRDGAAVDPHRACIGLARAAVASRARLFERSPVQKVTFGAHHVDVTLASGTIRADVVIVATGRPTKLFTPLQRHFDARERYLVLTEPVAAAVRKGLFDSRTCLRINGASAIGVRWTSDQRLLVTGGDQKEVAAAKRAPVLIQRTGQLMYDLLTRYPVIAGLRPAFGWDAPYSDTADGLPYIGPHRNYPRHLFALGGSSTSVTEAFLAARILARAVLGEPEKTDQVFGWTR